MVKFVSNRSIYSFGIVVEQRGLIERFKPGDYFLEAVKNTRKPTTNSINRKIGGKHAALDAEQRNGLYHHTSITVHCPILSWHAQSGYFNRRVGLFCEDSHRATHSLRHRCGQMANLCGSE